MHEAPRARIWHLARGEMSLDRPRLMGIVNVTPDSFFDGGRHHALDAALLQAETLIAEGADLLDIGGESTRPGAKPVTASEELERVIPVIQAIAEHWPQIPLSIDTVKSEVARAALDAGASVVNDVSGLRLDLGIGEVAARAGAGLVLMHSRGGVAEMASYATASYGDDPVGEVAAALSASAELALDAGVRADRIVLDPGLGFSKRTIDSVQVIAQLPRLLELGFPLMVGPSRKRFVGELSETETVDERLHGTLGACVAALWLGARLFRVHDVQAARRALLVADAILRQAS